MVRRIHIRPNFENNMVDDPYGTITQIGLVIVTKNPLSVKS